MMINAAGGERIVDLTDTTQTHTQVDIPCCTTAVLEVTTMDRTLIAVAVTAVDTTIAINQGIAVIDAVVMTV